MSDDVVYAPPSMDDVQLVESVEGGSSYNCDKSVIKVKVNLEAKGAPIFSTATREEAMDTLQQDWKKIVHEVEQLSGWGQLCDNGVREYIQRLEDEGRKLPVEVILKVLVTLLTPIHQLNIYKTLTKQEGNHSPGEELWDGETFEYCEYVNGKQMDPVLRCVFVKGSDIGDVVYSIIKEMENTPHPFGGRSTWWSTVRALSSVRFV